MKKEDNEWSIEEDNDTDWGSHPRIFHINGEKYYMNEDFSGLTHAILLLVDAINDKKVL